MRQQDTSGPDSVSKAVRRNLSPRRLASVCGRLGRTLKNRGWQAAYREVLYRWRLLRHGEIWFYHADVPLRRELRAQEKAGFARMPLISVVVPVYNTPERFLYDMADSVLDQSYAKLELILVNASDEGHPQVGETCEKLAREDERVRHLRLSENLGIAGNTNAGLAAAKGEYIALLDHDDIYWRSALYEVVSAINETGADLLYSDEVVLSQDLKKLIVFHYKPDFGPDTLRGCNYFAHLLCFSRALLGAVGGGEDGAFDGAQDFDLVLRMSEKARLVHHIPKVLYAWRQHAGSTASGMEAKPAALNAGARAIDAQLARLGLAGAAQPNAAPYTGSYRVHYEVGGEPLVSVIIPSKDHIEDLGRCLSSLRQKAGWPRLEVLVVENNSQQEETQRFYEAALAEYDNLRILRYEGGFNFAAICNFGAAAARGEHLLLLNNDIEIESEGYVRELLGYSQRADVGAVGAKLFYPNDEVQHGGLIVGIAGTAGTSHKGHPRDSAGLMFRLVTAQNYSAVTGASLMVKASLYAEMGGMDEQRFAVAFNDVDLCLRLREAGYWNVFTPFAVATHYESKSRGLDLQGAAKQRFDKEAAAFKARHAQILAAGDPFYNPHFTLDLENFAYR